MKPFLVLVLVFSITCFAGYTISAQSPKINKNKSELSEVSQLKAENFKLKAQLSQCSLQISNVQLKSEQSELTEQFRKELGAHAEDTFDWSNLTFKSTNPSSTK